MKEITILFVATLFSTLVFSQTNIELLSQVTYDDNLSDVWGYTDSTGREYAIVCLRGSISIEDLNDPVNPRTVAQFDAPRSTWRDAKTYGNFAYFTNENSGGLQIINLEALPAAPDTTDSYFWAPIIPDLGQLSSCHNLYIDTETGYGFLSGCNINNGGVLIIDLFSTPGDPVFVAAAAPIYSHDVYARGNLIYSSDINNGSFSIQDMSDVDNIITVARQNTPFNFTHNAWLSDDSNTIFTTDERGNAPIGAYDISDTDDIRLLDEFRPIASLNQNLIPHNVHVLNDFLVTSYYTEGIIITDANRPQNLVEVGNYDTFIGLNGTFSGVWGAFPYFDSGIVLASDIGSGLFVLRPNYTRACYLEGTVVDSLSGEALNGVSVIIFSNDPNEDVSNAMGVYRTGQVTSGTFTARYSKEGYETKNIEVNLVNGEVSIVDVALVNLSDVTTSIPQIEELERFNVFPNPFANNFNVEFEFSSLPEETSLVVSDLLGRKIVQLSITAQRDRLTLGQDWNNGLYMVQLVNREGVSFPIRIVKNGE